MPAAPGPPAPRAALVPERSYELRSYGESANDLVELLVPYLATRGFREDRPRRTLPSGLLQAVFASGSAEFLTVVGPTNCLLLSFYVSPGTGPTGPGGRTERVGEFRRGLERYLASLPTPRPTLSDVRLGTGTACRPLR